MKTRLALTILLGCTTHSALAVTSDTDAKVRMGEWSVFVPARCADKVQISEVEATPLYSAEDAAALASDPTNTLKPDYTNMPAHWRLDLSACLGGSERSFATELLILPVDEYLGIYEPSRKPDPAMRASFGALKRWIADAATTSAWPFIPFVDESPIAVLGPQRLRSPSLNGARVLTQFTPDVGLLQSGALTYIYQALSADGKSYVLMTVPLRAASLAGPDDQSHWGYSIDDLDGHPDRQQAYAKAAEAWLQQHASEIEPALSELDAIAQRLAREPK